MNMSLSEMIGNLGFVAGAVVVTLLLLSVWSISVMIERWRTFRAARKQSIEFLPAMVKALKEGKLQQAVDVSKKYNKSHVAKVVSAGIQEYLNQEGPTATTSDRIDAVRRSLEMTGALTAAEMKKGLAGLATIGSTAPFIGLFGTVVGIINAFTGMALTGSGGLAAISAGIAEALITTAFGLLVAIPAVMAFNYFTSLHERFQIEMTNSAAEIVDFFLKKQGVSRGNA